MENWKQEVIKNNGGTFVSFGELGMRMISHHNVGYYVALNGKRITIKEFETWKQNDLNLPSGCYLGFWIDNGIVYIDLTIHIDKQGQAIAIGKFCNQKSIWDCKNRKAIYL